MKRGMKRGGSSMLLEYRKGRKRSQFIFSRVTLLNVGKGKVTKKESQVFIRNNVASLHDFIYIKLRDIICFFL